MTPLENDRNRSTDRGETMYSRTRLLLIAAAATIVAMVAWAAAWMIDAYYQDAMHMAFRVDLACDWTQDEYYCEEAATTATKYMDVQDFIPSTIVGSVLWTGGVIAIAVALWALDSVVKQTRAMWTARRAITDQRERRMMHRLMLVEIGLNDSRATTAMLMRDSFVN